jgi:dihydroorotate dehydrogenase
MTGYGYLYRSGLSRLDPEDAHSLALRGLRGTARAPGGARALRALAPEPDDRLRLRVWDLPFVNPLGVAAGLDKDGLAVEALLALGFSHVEVGTVTLRPQPGNARPRVWRAPEHGAVLNAMGFPSGGAAAVRNRLLPLRPPGIIGINIGKNADTPLEQATEDYVALVEALFEVAQYITVNVSSPNTTGLRSLQMADQLSGLLTDVRAANERMGKILRYPPRPLLVKIAPDLTDAEIEGIAEAAIANGAVGIVATNTTIARAGIDPRFADHPGGLSGAPLRERAEQIMRVLYRRVGGQVPLVGVGGISSGADAVARIRAGATLVQLYTGFIYAGPALPGRILREMSADADRNGWRSITDLVGQDT